MTRKDFHKVIIGRAELVHFMDFEIADVPAKVDTGAYRSAVHAEDIFVDDSGLLNFNILGSHKVCGAISRTHKTKDFKIVTIANSFGHEEDRYEVKLKVKLGPKIFNTTFTLANRSKKIYPILLGRKMIKDRFLVDVTETSVDRVKLKKQYGIVLPSDEEEGDK